MNKHLLYAMTLISFASFNHALAGDCLARLEELQNIPAVVIVNGIEYCETLHAYNKLTQNKLSNADLKNIRQTSHFTSPLHKRTFLHAAAAGNHVSAIRYLVNNRNLNLNAQDSLGDTPLHYAIKKGNESAAEELAVLGANSQITNNDGHSARELIEQKKLFPIIIKPRIIRFAKEICDGSEDCCQICLEFDDHEAYTVSCLQCLTPICNPCRRLLIDQGNLRCPTCRGALARNVHAYKPAKLIETSNSGDENSDDTE